MSRRLPLGASSPGAGWETEEIVPHDSTGLSITFVKERTGEEEKIAGRRKEGGET